MRSIKTRTAGRVATAVAGTVLLVAFADPAQAAPASAPVHRFADGSTVGGARTTLNRTDAGASMRFTTTELPAGHVVTVWWVIFNQPQNCTHPEGPFRCGPGDLPPFGGDDSAVTSLLYATGHVIGGSGRGSFGGHLATGDATDALWGPGLTDPIGADVHLVLHDHGAVEPQDRAQAIHDFGTCTPACVDIQFSVHE